MQQFIIECKQCGGQLEIADDNKLVTCKFCGSINTIPKSGELKSNLFNRANYLRRNNEFDKAIDAYEEILKEDVTEAEAHFGIALCKYGIEYVEDPKSGERIPTCHRTQFDSILIDYNYKQALEYSSYDVKNAYENEAMRIDKLQKEILNISSKEEPYDIFICYKESDEQGERTQDSVIAQELYYELQKSGYKVFFARKTLEDKLGSAYEPIIFAALNSSKVMVVLGTKAEHFNSIWVKNEWSRFREMIKKGDKKVLIPAYKNISPYELPKEFSNLQALDMNKLGFIQDLCDGIRKITLSSDHTIQNQSNLNTTPSTQSLLKRAFIFLEDEDFDSAEEYFERVLDINPEESRAYIGKLLVDLAYKSEDDLINHDTDLTKYPDFNRALKFANPSEHNHYSSILNKRREIKLEKERLERERLRKEKEEFERQERLQEERERIEQERLEEQIQISKRKAIEEQIELQNKTNQMVIIFIIFIVIILFLLFFR
jgi:tetratricopeptide (TPR) repeat protein